MEERPSQSQPFRFWMPSWTSLTRSPQRPPISTRQKSLPRTPPQPSAQPQVQARSPPPALASSTASRKPTISRRVSQPPSPTSTASRKPTTSRRVSQPLSPTSSQKHGLLRSQPGNKNGKQPSRPRMDVESSPQLQSASQRASHLCSAATQVKSQIKSTQAFLPDSQSRSPARKGYHSSQPISLPHESQLVIKPTSPPILQPKLQAQATPLAKDINPAQPTSKPTRNHIRQEPNVPHVSINSLEKNSLESYSITAPQPSTSEKETAKIKLEKMEPPRLKKLEDTYKQDKEEKHKTKSITNHMVSLTKAPESDLTSEEMNRDKLTMTSDTKEEKPLTGVSNKVKEQRDFKQLSLAYENKPTRSNTQTVVSLSGNSNAEHRQDSDNEPTQDGSKRKERKLAISTIPQDSFFDGRRTIFKAEIKEGLSRLVQKIGAGYSDQPGDGPSVNVFTLAGKNNGASMVIGYEGMTRDNFHAYEVHKLDENKVEASSNDDEERWNHNGKTAFTASINSNVQSINDSIIDKSSCSVRNPGVRLNLSSKSKEPLFSKKTVKPLETERTSSKPIPTQRPIHEPRIRRRCLRALFMESSESDPENPQKPWRHGCRFSCEEKKKMKDDKYRMSTTNTSVQNNGEGISRA